MFQSFEYFILHVLQRFSSTGSLYCNFTVFVYFAVLTALPEFHIPKPNSSYCYWNDTEKSGMAPAHWMTTQIEKCTRFKVACQVSPPDEPRGSQQLGRVRLSLGSRSKPEKQQKPIIKTNGKKLANQFGDLLYRVPMALPP